MVSIKSIVVHMIHVVEENFVDYPNVLENLVLDSRKPSYDGCAKFTRLSVVLKLCNLKAGNGWIDKSFNALLQLMKEMLPENNVLRDHTYEAKKVLCSMGLEYEKIQACPNDCILYRNEYESLDSCATCVEPRYKKKGDPSKFLWYFPLVPIFRRLFDNKEDAQNMRWHASGRVCDGKLRHLVDSLEWMNIDSLFLDYGYKDKNLRLALSTDGMNLHGILSSSHSI